jgi:hypothetical protein
VEQDIGEQQVTRQAQADRLQVSADAVPPSKSGSPTAFTCSLDVIHAPATSESNIGRPILAEGIFDGR